MQAGDNNLRIQFVWPNIIAFTCKLDYDYVVDNLRGQCVLEQLQKAQVPSAVHMHVISK